MPYTRYFVLSVFLLAFIHLISTATIFSGQIPNFGKIEQPSTGQAESNSLQLAQRNLQAIAINQQSNAPDFSVIVSDINKVRSQNGIPAITQNASLNVIISQWEATVAGNMPLVQYLQLYGSLNMQTYTFEAVPGENVKEVVESQCKECYLQDYTQIGSYVQSLGVGNYFVIIVLSGGYGSVQQDYTTSQVNSVIAQIQNQQKSNGSVTTSIASSTTNGTNFDGSSANVKTNSITPISANQNSTTATTPVTPVLENNNSKAATNTSSNSTSTSPAAVANTSVVNPVNPTSPANSSASTEANGTNSNGSSAQATTTQQNATTTPSQPIANTTSQNIPNSTPSQIVQITTIPIPTLPVTPAIPNLSTTQITPTIPTTSTTPSTQTNSTTPATITTTISQTTPIVQNTSTTLPTANTSTTPTTPNTPTTTTQTTTTTPSTQTNTTTTTLPTIPGLPAVPTTPTQAVVQITTPTQSTTPTKTTTSTLPNTTVPNQSTTTIPTQSTAQTVSDLTNKTVTTPANSSTNTNTITAVNVVPKNSNYGNSLTSSLPLITQTSFGTTTTFPNIFLNHSIPTNFVKLQIFYFRGSILIPNTNGINVNVIFNRITDQRQLSFSVYLPANQVNFQIPTYLNLTGKYYLSVFAGSYGQTLQQVFTINPSFIGSLISRAPNPIQNASLGLRGNDLWLQWIFNDIAQPCITQLIFSQVGGSNLTYLLSNYQLQFQVPYADFAFFNVGPVNLQITEAFSNTESANSRTSAYSAPFNIIFNAVQHNFAIITSNSGLNSIPLRVSPSTTSINVSGLSNVLLQNQVVLLAPNNQIQKYLINPALTSETVPIGTRINLNIPLNKTGVYILQVNDGGGSAVYNCPIYYGDAYPLLPDFKDLSPGYSDLSALQEPQLIYDRRHLVFNLINQIRSANGVNNLYLDDKLNSLAQNYAEAMISQNFFGHVDNQGRNPTQRAAGYNITEGVGENLATNMNLTEGQLMLQRSPAHLAVMVDPSFTRVGLGIKQNSIGAYYLVQEYSSRDLNKYPLTTVELLAIKNQFVYYLQSLYPSVKSQNATLSQILSSYQNLTNRPEIVSFVRNQRVTGNIYVFNLNVSYNGGQYMSIVQNSATGLPVNGKSQVGLTVAYMAESGMLQAFGVFA